MQSTMSHHPEGSPSTFINLKLRFYAMPFSQPQNFLHGPCFSPSLKHPGVREADRSVTRGDAATTLPAIDGPAAVN